MNNMKYFTYIIIGVVALAIVAGFFIVGSPIEQKQLQLDERRIQDLSFLQSEILNYWQNKNVLPEQLALLRDDLRGVAVPMDPENQSAYEYQIKGPESFALCATFALPSFGSDSPKSRPASYYAEPLIGQSNWEHTGGRVCFERTIDKDFYKLKKN